MAEHNIHNVTDGVDIALLFKEHNGLLLTGPAGVGKSWVLRNVKAELQRLLPGTKVLSMALRHAAAMLINGKTIAHYLHVYKAAGGAPPPGTICIVDEWSEVQLHLWVELARWHLVGVRFIIVGDADGQRGPSYDTWEDAMRSKDIRNSHLIHEMAGGLRVKLTEYRRGLDEELFEYYTGLYPLADDNTRVRATVAQGLRQYPTRGVICDCYFVVRHDTRVPMNRMLMHHFAGLAQGPVMFLPAPENYPERIQMQPQAMLLWAGLELVCYSERCATKNNPVTGAVYVVQGFTERTVCKLKRAIKKDEGDPT